MTDHPSPPRPGAARPGAARPGWRRRDALLLPAALAAATPARAEGRVIDLLLVLAIDASGSIDADEFRLQREGCAQAITRPACIARSRGW